MEDTRRILRYIIPGWVFAFELALWSFISNPTFFQCTYNKLSQTQGAAVIVTAILMSGGIGFGYLLSLLHHLLWSCSWLPRTLRYGIDYRDLLEQARQQDDLWVYLYGATEPDERPLTYAGSWRIVTSLYHGARRASKLLEGALFRADTLSDLMHGTGTVFVGSVAAYLFWLWLVVLKHGDPLPANLTPWAFISKYLFPLIFIAGHIISYGIAKAHCQGFISAIFLSHLTRERERSGKALRIYTTESDFEKEGSRGRHVTIWLNKETIAPLEQRAKREKRRISQIIIADLARVNKRGPVNENEGDST